MLPGEVSPDSQAAETSAPTPRPASREHGFARFHFYWWVIVAVVVVDQITKALIRAHLPLYDSIAVIPGFIDVIHVRNAGVAFGLMNGLKLPFQPVLTTLLALGALVGISLYARHIRREERWARAGLSLILGGAFGNLIDRITAGYVIDFIDASWRGWHFWAFNVADASITIGAVLVFIDLLLVNRHASHTV